MSFSIVKEKFAFVAAVTNYGYNNHPDGHDAIFEGLRFMDAVRTLEEYEYLRDSCQVLVALTHIGSKYDRELADEASEYDLIIGGHSHERINEVEDGVLITQTGRNLNMVGLPRCDCEARRSGPCRSGWFRWPTTRPTRFIRRWSRPTATIRC